VKIRHDHDAGVVIVALSASVSLAERIVLGLGSIAHFVC
jgi:hypothetical protein